MLYIKSLFIGLILFAASIAHCASREEEKTTITGKVIKIRDGDTIEILYEGKSMTVRLAHVDCPERKQPYGNRARQWTTALCFGQIVKVQNKQEFDRYGRLIGVVINSKKDTVNLELVKAGLAWHYKKFSTDQSYADAEKRARAEKVGLWADKNPIAPWDWR